jgi:uncharacterized protein (TIGR03437 family)
LFASALLAQKPFQNGQAARAVVGQITFTAGNNNPSQQILGGASGVAWAGNRLYVADSNRVAASPLDDRVVVFDTTLIPDAHTDLVQDGALYGQPSCYVCGTQASLVLGQNTFYPPTWTPSGQSTTQAAYYPGVNGGQDPANTSTPENASLNNATAVASDGVRLAVADTDNNRVLVWNTIPTSNNQHPTLVLGQPDFNTVQQQQQGVVTATTMRGPQGVWISNNKLYVADTQNYRILIWNTFPTTNNQAPDVVLGQPDFTHANGPVPSSTAPPAAANQLLNPVSVTADNSHVFVADLGFNRVLIWNTTSPTTYQNADVVVGQPDFVGSAANNPTVCTGLTTGPSTSVTTVTGTVVTLPGPCATSLNFPRFALSDGSRLFIADGGNDRVLIYNTIPTTNGVIASNVLGQVTFYTDIVTSQAISIVSTQVDNTGGVDTTPSPTSLAWDGTNLYVADPFNRRVLLFTAGDSLIPSPFDPAAKVVPVVNWAAEIVRQEATVVLTLASGGAITANDTATITIQGTAYTYTEKKTDTLDGISRALVNLINASDPNTTATFAGPGTATIYLSSKATNLGYDTITLAASTSNTVNVNATASGSYLSAGNAATVSPGTLIEVNAPPGVSFTDSTATLTPQFSGGLPDDLGGVQLYLDGFASPLWKVSPTQLVGQVPYFYGDRNSTSVYVRTVHNDGSVTVTNATPVYIAPANPGIFNAPQYPRQVRPWPASMAYHQLNNPSAVVSVDGSVTAGNTATITVGSTSYTYTVLSTDTLATIVTALINLINNGSTPDPNVIASAGGTFTRVVLTARFDGFHGGNGIAVATSTSSGATVTLTAYSSATCCAVNNGSPISSGNPAVPGELISISAAGLGSIDDINGNSVHLVTGQPFAGPGTDNVLPANFVAATMGGSTAQVIYAGLPAGSYGIYRIDLIVPTTLSADANTPLYIAQNAFISNTVSVAVGAAVSNPPRPATTVSQPVIFMSVDTPQSGATVSGVTPVAGWALDISYPLASISVSVDGIPHSTAGYGGDRADACAVYTTGINCPYVGFDGTVDTSTVGNGVHIFQVTVTDTGGNVFTSATSNVTVSNNPASYPTHVGIDSPYGGATYHGVVNFGGWALNDNSPIVAFKGAIDAMPINASAVTYGAPRPDVCSAANYPGRPGCPNVGWGYLADLSVLANGTHTFSFTAIAASGAQYTLVNSFVVDNFTAESSTNGPQVNIDTPSPSAGALSGVTPVAGWAIDSLTPIYSVQLLVDGTLYSSANYGAVRSDVCAVFNAPGCPNVGFDGSLDTTVLSDGTHTLQLIGYPIGGQPYSATRQITVDNQNTSGIHVNIDNPNALSPSLSGITGVAGWAVGNSSPIQTVTISVDGVLNGTATYGGLRPDVCEMFTARPDCPNVGWNYTLDTTRLTNGSHSLEATGTTATGQRATVANTFTVANASTAGKVNIDTPGANNNPYSGIGLMKGWALNANARIVSVAVSVDGVPVGNAAYGSARPDICTSSAVSPDCPDIGWTYALNTTLLTDGPHTFGVLATAADGTTSSASASFTVANWTAVTPMNIDLDAPNGDTQTPYTGTVVFGGWLYDSLASIQNVSVSVDGIPFGNAGIHGARPDVCTSTSVSPDCPNVGWTILVDTGFLSNDVHTLTVTGTTVTGQSYSVSRQFTSAN